MLGNQCFALIGRLLCIYCPNTIIFTEDLDDQLSHILLANFDEVFSEVWY